MPQIGAVIKAEDIENCDATYSGVEIRNYFVTWCSGKIDTVCDLHHVQHTELDVTQSEIK